MSDTSKTITPGPWTYDASAESVTTHDGLMVADIFGDNGEIAPNGRAIAAVPDMIEALRAVISDAHVQADPNSAWPIQNGIAKARAALEKAGQV